MDVFIIFALLCVVIPCLAQQQKLEFSLSEGSSSKDFAENVGVESGVDASVVPSPKYNFENDQAWQKLFVLEEDTGILKTNGTIDREPVCPKLAECAINLDIIVTSSISSIYYELIQVTVYILDINDNSPYFQSDEVEEDIMENANIGAKIPLPKAIDLDSPANGVKGYRLLNQVSQFTLEAEGSAGNDVNPVLILQTQLDREVLDRIQLELVAFDSTNTTFANTAHLKVIISIQDVNDNPPEFTKQEYALILDEDQATMTTLVTVHATDPDLDENGELVYSFDEATPVIYTSLFSIDGETGDLVLINKLDYEETTQIVLTVLATEKNPSNMPAKAKITITIRDINDNKPVITLFTSSPDNLEFISIKENLQAGAFLARLKVTDQDSGPNGAVTCEMETSMPDVFLLQLLSYHNYKFITNKSLDRELQANYTVVFLCRDGGLTSQQETRLTKLVVVEDENDNTPLLTKSNFSFTLHENNPVGVQLLQLQASDPDSGSNGEVKYTLLSSPTQYISIHPHTGSITTLVAFDYEQDPLLTFLVAAYDQGAPSKTTTATIEIHVLDINDEPPVFGAKHYMFNVFENLKLGADVGQVTATDPDSSQYNEHYFAFVSGGPYNNLFAIEPSSGNIYTRTSFDRELKDFYELQIIAYDKLDPSLSSTINATVTIDDQNDHPPIIIFPKEGNNTVYVGPVPSDIKQPLLQVLAFDGDQGQNAVLEYLLETEHIDVFIMDQSTGHLYVKDTDKLYTQPEYALDIKVQDQGETPLFAMTQIVVLVETNPEVLATNTVIIIVVGVISGIVVSSLVISIALILFKRKAKKDKEKQLGVPGKHYTVKPVEGDVEADNVSELSASVLNNSQQTGHSDMQVDRNQEIRPHQLPNYDPLGYDISEVKDKLSETSNSDSGLGSYEDSQRVVHRLSPTEGIHVKGITLIPTETPQSPCKPSPTDSAYGTDVTMPKHNRDSGSLIPSQHQLFIQPRNGEVGNRYPTDTSNELTKSKGQHIKGNTTAAHHLQFHQFPPEYTSELGHHNIRNMASVDQNNHSRKSSPVRSVHPKQNYQNNKRKSEPETISAHSTPSKQKEKSKVPLSQRSNSSGPFDRHQNYSDKTKPPLYTDRRRKSSQKSAHRSSQGHSRTTNHDPPLSPNKPHHLHGSYPEQNTGKSTPVCNSMNSVAGHEVGIFHPERQQQKSPHKSRRSRREKEEMAGNSQGGKNQEVTSSLGVDHSSSFNSRGVSGRYKNNSPVRAQHLNRYPRDDTGSTVVSTQNSKHIPNSCEPNIASSSPFTHSSSGEMRCPNYKEGTGEESVV